MLVTIYITIAPGWDRPFVSTIPPQPTMDPSWKFYSVEAELPGYEMLDGNVRAVATPVDHPGIRLPEVAKPV